MSHWQVGLYDSNNKFIMGQKYMSTKKNAEKAKSFFNVNTEAEADYMVNLVSKYFPYAKILV